MAVDLSEFKALSAKSNGCTIGRILEQLPDKDSTNLRAALAADINEISHTAIESWLAKRDVKVGVGPIGRHRRGACNCA